MIFLSVFLMGFQLIWKKCVDYFINLSKREILHQYLKQQIK